MAQKVFEDKEFHGSVKFFGETIIDIVGSFIYSGTTLVTFGGALTIAGDLIVGSGDIKMDALKKFYLDGGNDTYMVESLANTLSWFIADLEVLRLTSTYLGTREISGYWRLATILSSSTVPAYTFRGDTNTGMGFGGADKLSLIAGGKEIMRLEEAGEHNIASLRDATKFDDRNTVTYFDDFNKKAFDSTNEQWILLSGSDPQAIDPAILAIERGGAVFLDAGDGDGTVAVDGSQLVFAIPVQVADGSLVFEARVKIEDITGCSVNIGLTDINTLEEPFSIASAIITSVADNAVCFTFDDGATLKEWYMLGVDGTTDATGNGALGSATKPVNDIYQILRCEIDADGEGAEFFINGTSVGSLTASVVNSTQNLFFTCIIVGDSGNGAAVGLTVDYAYIAYQRKL